MIFENKEIDEIEYIYNLDESADYIYVEFEGDGYALYARTTMEILEYSLQGKLPYNNTSNKKYYAGPSQYIEKSNDKLINVLTGNQIYLNEDELTETAFEIREKIIERNINEGNTIAIVDNNVEKIIESSISSNKKSSPDIDSSNLIIPNGSNGKLIENAQYFFSNPTHGNNFAGGSYGNGNSGTCGPVAAQLLLSYNNYFHDRRIIENRFLNGYSDTSNSVVTPERNPNFSSDPMSMTRWTTGTRSEDTGENSFYSHIVTSIMRPNTSGSTLNEVRNGINSHLSSRIATSDYTLKKEEKGWFFGWSPIESSKIKSEINQDRPIIITMSSKLGGTDHVVVGYGYEDYTYPNGEGTYSGYVVHFGWQNRFNVWINESWCDGYISLKINSQHNYVDVGQIGATGAREMRCTITGHRTDAIINVNNRERYTERVVNLPQNNYKYKDYYVKFDSPGVKIIQTFGTKDTTLTLYNESGSVLASNDDGGYLRNAFINYNANSNVKYRIRVKFYSSSESGKIKLSITPSSGLYNTIPATKFDHIYGYGSTYWGNYFISGQTALNSSMMYIVNPQVTRTYSIRTSSYPGTQQYDDMYLYLVDPTSTELALYNDDGGGNRQAKITSEMVAGRPYLIIISTYNITTQVGRYSLYID